MANIDQVQLPDGSQYHIIDDTSGYATTTYVQDQIATINKNTIGLGNVDNTADINKPVSLPQQAALNGKVDDDIVAYVESDTTATKRHEVGDQFILNGVLLTATAIIAVNDTIVIGTNCDSAESVATQITENANAIVSLRSDITSINQTGTTATQAISSGTYFYLNEVLVRAKTDIASGATFTLNTNYETPTDGGLNQSMANRCLMSNGESVESNLKSTDISSDFTSTLCETFNAYKSGNVISIYFKCPAGTYTNGQTLITIPNKYKPKVKQIVSIYDYVTGGVKDASAWIDTTDMDIKLFFRESITSAFASSFIYMI